MPAFFRLKPGIDNAWVSEGDQLVATFSIASEAELVALFEKLGRPLLPFTKDTPHAIVGKGYAPDEFAKLASPIQWFPNHQSPGWGQIFGIRCFAEVREKEVTVALFGADGDPWKITDTDWENARKLEAELARAGLIPDPG